MNRLHFVAVGLAACCLTGQSRSEDTPKGDGASGKFFERMLKEFDKDGDGKLNEEERGTARRMTEQFLARLKENDGANGPRDFAQLLKRFDEDGDGKLNDDEKGAAKKALQGQAKKGQRPKIDLNNPPKTFVKQFDKDGDGKLNADEKIAAGEAIAKMAEGPREFPNPEMLKRYDKDGDGKLNDTEKAGAREAFTKLKGGPGGFPNREEMIKRFDKDGDGKLNDTEQAAARAEREKRGGGAGAAGGLTPGEGKPQESKLDKETLLKKFDKDGDGKLSDEERAAALEAFQNRDKEK